MIYILNKTKLITIRGNTDQMRPPTGPGRPCRMPGPGSQSCLHCKMMIFKNALTACVLVIDTLVVPGTRPLRVVVEGQEANETVVQRVVGVEELEDRLEFFLQEGLFYLKVKS